MNWSDFFSMGGYAFYVWGSYVITLLAFGGEVIILWRRHKSLKHAGLNNLEISKNEKTS
jgi:heme exporter protein D